jgi:protein-S-isoprenylcysteine O-methyltransferase Ste14
MSLALTRTATAYRVESRPLRPVRPARSYGELLSKIAILALFSSLATRLATDFAQTGHATGLLLVASEALVVAFTLVRRHASIVDRSWRARILTMFATFGPPLLVLAPGGPVAPEFLTLLISAVGLSIVVAGKLSLGRSFGLTPANRGVVSSGVYRMVRHPIYLGYLVTHVGFVLANPAGWNFAVLIAADFALMLRAICEEETLALDEQYRAYMARVRWRIVPGVF